MRINTPTAGTRPAGSTHEGAPAAHLTNEQLLRRSVLSCLLWEREFYEDGQAIADRITSLAKTVPTQVVADLAIQAREDYKLRHVPLLLLCELATRGGPVVGATIERVIQRADELTEFLALYWRAGKTPIAKQVKLGLARAFKKFDAYQLGKYDRANAIRLRDVLFLTHAKPKDGEQAALWAKLVANELEAPDTWEVALSGGADKAETFTRLLREDKLGYLALLRNLRNMTQAGVDLELIKTAIRARKGAHRVLPFRYTAAARVVPQLEPVLDEALCEAIAEIPVLPGKTVVLVDVSGSMDAALSAKSDMTRMLAAATLASIIPGDVRVFTFSHSLVEVPPRRGMAGVDAVVRSQPHGGTYLGQALQKLHGLTRYDRLIVITDEQSHDSVGRPLAGAHGYMINVASAQNGVGYGPWVRINGFSEAVLGFIAEHERAGA